MDRMEPLTIKLSGCETVYFLKQGRTLPGSETTGYLFVVGICAICMQDRFLFALKQTVSLPDSDIDTTVNV
jgi:hypothetical protein